MGKSSLIARTAEKLRSVGITVVSLTLDNTEIDYSSEESWYVSLLCMIAEKIGLEDIIDASLQDSRKRDASSIFFNALRSVILPAIKERPGTGKLVIFVDEVDHLLGKKFSSDSFFTGIRSCFNQRYEYPILNDLAFCLAGVAAPSDLIQDERTTPFNIGRDIPLDDFTPDEADILCAGFKERTNSSRIMKRILYWTNGHPYLTQALCYEVAENQDVKSVAGVDSLCRDIFFAPQTQEINRNLAFVRKSLLESRGDVAARLLLLHKIRGSWRGVATGESDPSVPALRLAGIVRQANGRFKYRNEIYARIFDRKWLNNHVPGQEKRRQRGAFLKAALPLSTISIVIGALAIGYGVTALKYKLAKENLEASLKAQSKTQEELKRSLIDAEREKFLADVNSKRANDSELRAKTKSIEADNQRKLANLQADKATQAKIEANKQKAFANSQKEYANDQKNIAVMEKMNSDRLKYDADVSQLGLLWETHNSGQLNDLRIRDILDSNRKKGISRFEWGYWDKRCPIKLNLKLHTTVICAEINRDRTYAVTGGSDGSILLWDLNTGTSKPLYSDHRREIISAVFTPDSSRVAISYRNSILDVVETKSGKRIYHKQFGKKTEFSTLLFRSSNALLANAAQNSLRLINLTTRKSEVIDVVNRNNKKFALSPDGDHYLFVEKELVSNEQREKRGPEIRRLSNPEESISLIDFKNVHEIRTVAWSSDGGRIALNIYPAATKIYDANSGELVRDLLSNGLIGAMALNWDGTLAAVSGTDNSIQILDVASNREVATLKGHSSIVHTLRFSDDGSRLISGSDDGTVKIWSLETGADSVVWREAKHGPVTTVFRSDGEIVYASVVHDAIASLNNAGEIVQIFSETAKVKSTAQPYRPKLQLERVNLSENGRNLITAYSNGEIVVWDAETLKPIRHISTHLKHIDSVQLLPDAKTLFVIQSIFQPLSSSIHAYDLFSGKQTDPLQLSRRGDTDFVSVSPNGASIAGEFRKRGSIGESRTKLTVLRKNADAVAAISIKTDSEPTELIFNNDGSKLLATLEDNNGQIFDASTGKKLALLKGHTSKITAAAYDRTGERIVSGDSDGFVKIWDAISGRELLTLKSKDKNICSVAFSRDSLRIVVGTESGSVTIWNGKPSKSSLLLNKQSLWQDALDRQQAALNAVNQQRSNSGKKPYKPASNQKTN